jgi:hypothetical protein
VPDAFEPDDILINGAAQHLRRKDVPSLPRQAAHRRLSPTPLPDNIMSHDNSSHDNPKSDDGTPEKRLRSRRWFDDPADPGMTALYLERYMNYGITREELQSGKPIIGIAQTGSDLAPCNRHHLQLAQRVRDGIRDAGGIPLEFPVHPIQETGKRPTGSRAGSPPVATRLRPRV